VLAAMTDAWEAGHPDTVARMLSRSELMVASTALGS
jgi:hypothetical protein